MRRVRLLGAMVIGFLPSCNTQRTGEQRPVAQAVEPAAAVEANEKPSAAASPQAAQKIALAITRHPEPYLAVRGATGVASLRAQAGKSIALSLSIPGLVRWADANIARFVVRLPGGIETIPFDSAVSRGLVTYTFPTAGPAMLMFCAGPKVEPAGDSFANVTHCTKMVVNVSDGRQAAEVADDFTGETGLPLDVVPLVSPLRLTVGSELPVSFHYLNEEQGGIAVAALRPDGSIDQQLTSESGVAHFQITRPGRWIIRFVKEHPGGDRVGELVFGIPEKSK